MLNNILSGLGLTTEETNTYVLLLELGPTTVGNLAQKMGKPRPSLYGFLKRLQEKGMVVQSLKFGTKTFLAEPPEKITLLFKQKIEDLENKQKLYNNILPELEKTIPSKFLNPKFQLYEGENGLKHVLKDMLLYRNVETQAFWPIKAMLEILSPEFFRYHNKERIRNKISIRAIWSAHQAVDIKDYPYLGSREELRRELRIAPKEINFSMGYWIYKNKAAFISSRKESFGFIIESKELVDMLLSQFELVWKLSKPVTTKPEDADSFLKEVL